MPISMARRQYYWIQQSIKDQHFDSKYALGNEIGRGKSSIVYTCKRKGLSQIWAVKILRKNLEKKVYLADIGILLGLNHENLVRLQEIFETRTRIYIIQELEYGGELFDRIATLSEYTELVAARAIKDIISGINYLHNCGYVLRNLKCMWFYHSQPENLLYATVTEESRLLIADFAMSSLISPEVDMSSVCGSPAYTAPEVLKGVRCGKPGDMWAVGVILYILLCGYEPFSSDNPSQLFKKILKGHYEFISEYWENVSLNGRDVIKKLLILDPELRLSASAALRSIWVQGSVPRAVHMSEVVTRIQQFNERRKGKTEISQLEVNTIHPNKNPRFLLYV